MEDHLWIFSHLLEEDSSDDDDDDELLQDLCWLVGCVGRTNINRKYSFVQEIVNSFSDEEFKRNFRLTREAFNWVQSQIKDKLDTNSKYKANIPSEKQLLAAIWILSTPDSYRQVQDRARFFSENQFIIGDKAYPLCMYCITPYIDRGNLQAHHLHFNKRHAQTRQVIERSFALLFGRFRRLKYLDMTKTEFIPQTVQAACVLHNVCLMHQGNFEQYEEEGLQFLNIQNYDHDDNEEALGVEGIAREFRE
ncbi:hypothetical protein NQ314_001539, partial [Rhamnusium bicolor]